MREEPRAAPGTKPWLALVLGLFVPGLGHVYGGLYVRAAAVFVGVVTGFLGLAFVIDALVEVNEGFAVVYYLLLLGSAWDACRCARAALAAEPAREVEPAPSTGTVLARRALAWLQILLFILCLPAVLAVLFLGFLFGSAYILGELGAGSWSAFLKVPAALIGLLLAGGAAWVLYRDLNAFFQIASGQAPADSWRKAVNPWAILLVLITAAVAVPQFSRAIRVSKEGATYANLGAIRSALGRYRQEQGGAYPPDLSALALGGKYLREIPPARTSPYHPDSAGVRPLTDAEVSARAFDDSGGWAYVVDGSSAGTVWVNCTHTNVRGGAWNSY